MERLQLEQIVLESTRRNSQAQMDFLTSIFNKLSVMTSVLIYMRQNLLLIACRNARMVVKVLFNKNKTDS